MTASGAVSVGVVDVGSTVRDRVRVCVCVDSW